jgi:hypothetical protein
MLPSKRGASTLRIALRERSEDRTKWAQRSLITRSPYHLTEDIRNWGENCVYLGPAIYSAIIDLLIPISVAHVLAYIASAAASK